jgi:hypothetical protein
MLDIQKTLNQRHDTMSQLLTPIDTVKIMDTMKKLKEALCEVTARNAELARRSNQLTIELSYMPPKMHDMIMQAKRSHSNIYSNQRTDPHYLVPERPIEFAFERADPNDKRLSLLQRCATYYSVSNLLDETSDLTHLMSTVSKQDATEVDKNDNGNNAEGADNNPPTISQENSQGEDAGKRKRNQDSIVQRGHQAHPSQVQRMNSTPNFPNEVIQNNPNLTNQSGSVNDADMQMDAFPETEQQTAFIESAHFGGPKIPTRQLGDKVGNMKSPRKIPCRLTTFLPTPLGRGKLASRLIKAKAKRKAKEEAK